MLGRAKAYEKDDWVFRRKNGRRIVSFGGAFDIAARKAGIAERDAEYREPFTPRCFRRPAISRWAKVGLPAAIVRMCSGHADRDVHENYITFKDRELVDAFDKAGLLSPPAPVQHHASVGEKEAAIASVG